jgi:hypothetical protein
MKVAIVGSRTFRDLNRVRRYVRELPPDSVVISGGARGVDITAQRAAEEHGLKTKIFLPEWDKYGKSAGFKRNTLIVQACDHLVAFWDGTSRGTKHSIDLAKQQGKPVDIFEE